MDKFLKALQKGEVSFTPTNTPPLRTTEELRNVIKRMNQKPKGRKAKLVEVDGEERTLREWAEFFEIDYPRLYYFYTKKKLRGRKLIDTARAK